MDQCDGLVPSVTVVLNTYNRRDSLERTLVALRDQAYPRFEVVVVNGPSTDGTGELLDSFANRARLFECGEASVGVSRNIGVQNSAGEILAFVDDDAIPPPDWLECLVTPFRNERIAGVGGPVFDVPLDRFDWRICTSTRLGVVDTDCPEPIGMYQGIGADPFPYLAGCNMGLRRTALRSVGGFNSALPYAYDDTDVCCQLNDAGYVFEYVDELTVRHFRAVNAMRDEVQLIKDPYKLALGRIVFVSHCRQGFRSRNELKRLARQWEQEWNTYSSIHLDSGRFSMERHKQFVARAAAGTIEGLALARKRRPFATIGAPAINEFRPYR